LRTTEITTQPANYRGTFDLFVTLSFRYDAVVAGMDKGNQDCSCHDLQLTPARLSWSSFVGMQLKNKSRQARDNGLSSRSLNVLVHGTHRHVALVCNDWVSAAPPEMKRQCQQTQGRKEKLWSCHGVGDKRGRQLKV